MNLNVDFSVFVACFWYYLAWNGHDPAFSSMTKLLKNPIVVNYENKSC